MKSTDTRYVRTMLQLSSFCILICLVALYSLYTGGILDFKLLGTGDMNPYGGWSILREYTAGGSHTFEGISRSTALTLALLIMAVLGGRFFCGWICPLGALQDFSSWMGRKSGMPKYRAINFGKFNPSFLKYPVLLALLLISILGKGAEIAGLSPWRALLSLPKLPYSWTEIMPGFILLAGIIIVSMFIPRFFCRYLCPLGAAQALFSSISLFSLKAGKGCSSCNSCLKNCPAGIRLSPGENSISPECIRCLDCIENCPIKEDQGIKLKAAAENIPVKVYISLMLLVFVTVWFCVPMLFPGSSITGSIPKGALKDGIYQGEARGFAGRIVTEVVIADSRITGIKVLEHNESRGWYEEVFTVLPKEIIKKQRLDVDAISGATKTSIGFVKSLENAVKKAAE